MKEFIDQNKCTPFELFMLYIMCYLKEDDLYEEMKDYKYIALGEMERYSRFGIDWTTIRDLQELVTLDDNDERWELENKIQDVAEAAYKLYKYMKENNLVSGEGLIKDTTRYCITSTNN